MSRRLRITHSTEYHYRQPVRFGAHQVMMRPREDHDQRIVSFRAEVHPQPAVRWLRDIYDNSIAVLTFKDESDLLRIGGEAEVMVREQGLPEFAIEAGAASFPFQYDAAEQIEIIPYRIPSYPHDSAVVHEWLKELYAPGRDVNTSELLLALNTRIHTAFRYLHREESGVQLPCETLQKGSGSCRDYAVFMMEAARHWGFAARFVTGYIRMNEGQHGATHAWTEVYLPGQGWFGFDPTNNKMAGAEHVAVAVARNQEKAAPVSGSWSGPPEAFDRMEVVVKVEEL